MAFADEVTPSTDVVSAGHGHGVWLEGLGLDVAGAATTLSEYDSAVTDTDSLNVELLGGLANVDLGTIDLPLISDGTNGGLLYLGGLGSISSYSNSPSETRSVASSGVINADGSINLDPVNDPASFENASLDVTRLLNQLGLEGLTDQVLDQANIELGALAARAEKNEGSVASEYMVSDLKLNLRSPAIGDVVGAVDGVVGTAGTSIDGLVGGGGAITSLVQTAVNALGSLNVAGVGVNASVQSLGIDTSSLVSDVRTELLQTTINNATTADGPSSINIDLSTGAINVDLEQLLIGPGGPYEGLNLNELPANTDVLSDEVVNAIVSGLTNALTGDADTYPNSLTSKVNQIVTNGVYGLAVDLHIRASVPLVGTTNIVLQDVNGGAATVGGLLGIDGYADAELDISGGVLGTILGLVTPILNTLLNGIGGALEPVVNTLVTSLSTTLNTTLQPVVTSLLGNDGQLLKSVLDGVATLTINEQPTETPIDGVGDLGGESFSVRALTANLLPLLGSGSVKLELASASVLAEDPAGATLTASPNPVDQGGTVTLTGTGFDPEEDVTITLPDGTTTTVQADENGEFTTTWDVPSDYEPGPADFTATGETSERIAEASTTVQAADGEGNVNASASASASAEAAADDDATASAQAAAQAAALANNDSDASAAADTTANAAAEAAADPDVSTAASAETQAAASASAQAAANSTADSDSAAAATAEASAAATADARAAASAASEVSANATSSNDASADASADVDADANAAANVNASASASASANADDDSNASAQAAAEAAALANNDSDASAAADTTANAAAEAAADPDASTTASADVSSDVNAAATAASQASADSTADSAQDAQASAAADAAASADSESAARAASEAAAEANSSSTASADAAADVTAAAEAQAAATTSTSSNANASASADATGASAASSADAKGGDAKGNKIAETGAASIAPLGIAAIVLLILGAGVVLLQRHRSKLQ